MIRKLSYFIFTDGLLIVAIAMSVGIVVLDFTGLLNQYKWLSDRHDTLVILMLGLVLANSVIERKLCLEEIARKLADIIKNNADSSQYLDSTEIVTKRIEKISKSASEVIMSSGSKSKGVAYLSSIEQAVKSNPLITHYRLLEGNVITHELHVHLLQIINNSNVNIGWTANEKYGNMLVTENGCLIAFPTPSSDAFYGLHLPGKINSQRYTQHFLEAFSKCIRIKNQ